MALSCGHSCCYILKRALLTVPTGYESGLKLEGPSVWGLHSFPRAGRAVISKEVSGKEYTRLQKASGDVKRPGTRTFTRWHSTGSRTTTQVTASASCGKWQNGSGHDEAMQSRCHKDVPMRLMMEIDRANIIEICGTNLQTQRKGHL